MKTWFKITLGILILVLLQATSQASGSASDITTAATRDSGLPRAGGLMAAESSPPTARLMAATATISGTIRRQDNNNPVQNVAVTVGWASSSQTVTTTAAGLYSVSGVPTGEQVFIHVRPPISERLVFRNWAVDSLPGDYVKDFYLENGYLLQGEFVQPGGAPYGESFWLSVGSVNDNERWSVTTTDGQFELVLPVDRIYTLEPANRPTPYWAPFTKVYLTSDTTGLVVELLNSPPPPYPTDPPRAELIEVGPPDADGNATVTGLAGSVEPLSAVVVINLNAPIVITTTSGASGEFEVSIYAPPGSSLLVKYDPAGDLVKELWLQTWADDPVGTAYDATTRLPGTILHVGRPAPGDGSSQQFYGVGASGDVGWAGWWISGTLQVPSAGDPPALAVQPGQTVTVTGRLRYTSPAITCAGPPTYTLQVRGRLRHTFDADGQSHPWGIWFNSFLFTPTGLPIEREPGGQVEHFDQRIMGTPSCVTSQTFDVPLWYSFTIPIDLPHGIYQPQLAVFSDVPASNDEPYISVWYDDPESAPLPPLTVGSPAAPRIPATLLGDYPVNGHRGVQARQDVGQYAMPTRVVYPPHSVVIPRFDSRTGEPLAYRLEPGSHWLSANERRQPCQPFIPLALPSGSLAVEILRPDGSVEQLGPAPILQSSQRTPTTPGGDLLHEGTGHINDLYHLTTLNDAFDYSFDQYGRHVIYVLGSVNDIYGNSYNIEGTYDVIVAQVLDLDPGQLPTTPYVQNDAFSPGLHIFPPVPADVVIQLVHLPYSDPVQAITTTITGQANRFGYFQPAAGTAYTLSTPGEFRVDITAIYTDSEGTLWAGYMTWGNVVEGTTPAMLAHGRRGMDYSSETIDDMPPWFLNSWLPALGKLGIENYYPYFSGDLHWGDELGGDGSSAGDSIHTIITVEDLPGDPDIYGIMESHYPRATSCFRGPPNCSFTGFISRTLIGEAPLFITTRSGIDPEVAPEEIDLLGYWYGSSQRPDVRVRELVSEDGMATAYWRFGDTYAYQLGEPADGDQPGDIKWEFGGVVFRTITDTNPINEYAIYSSLWVLLPYTDTMGARVTAPFRGAGELDGGPILTLQGTDIDMLFLPKGVRPGDVLEVGDVVAFSGHVGPPLDSRVSVTITPPVAPPITAVWHANKIGWVYDPGFDFQALEPGRWTVDVQVLHDRVYEPTGLNPNTNPYFSQFNTGTVLGTSGQYEFYVVEPGSPRLTITSPQPGYISWNSGEIEPIHIRGIAPPGTTAVHYTVHDKGIVMDQGTAVPDSSGTFTVTYDAVALHDIFPMLSLTAHEGQWEGLADEVAINMLAVGGEPRAATVTLIGEQVFVGEDARRFIYLPLVLRQS